MNEDVKQQNFVRPFSRKKILRSMGNINWEVKGKVLDIVGNLVYASIKGVSLGSVVNIENKSNSIPILAEVVGFRDEKTLLLPFSSLTGISPGSLISTRGLWNTIPVGDFLLGQVIDPFMNPLTETSLKVPLHPERMVIDREAPNPMKRTTINSTFSLGVKAIDGLLTFGEGQRTGIFAGSGVGKSVLMGMIARGSEADVNVIGLIGERGREVREFLEKDLGPEGLKKSVVVVVTSDQSPLMRVRAALVLMTIAEHFSKHGKRVLVMMDSLTRVAMAQREIGLAIGEPPTTKGYTPSVFSLLPKLLERCGPQPKSHGSISGLFSVLVDGDDMDDPIADSARAILDGHIVLSRAIAARGHYPAIDVGMSTSRLMHKIVNDEHAQLARELKSLIACYQENFDYIQFGSYVQGTNPTLDRALALMPSIDNFLSQDIKQLSTLNSALSDMYRIFGISPPEERSN